MQRLKTENYGGFMLKYFLELHIYIPNPLCLLCVLHLVLTAFQERRKDNEQ